MGKKYCFYGRVSTEKQSLEKQKEKFKEYIERKDLDPEDYIIITEKVSSISEREGFNEIMDNLEEFEYLITTKIDRLARSLKDIVVISEKLSENNTVYVALDQGISTETKQGEFFFKNMGLIAELERNMIRERMKENYQKALEKGKVGRKRKITGKAKEKVIEWHKKGYGISDIQALLKEFFDIDVKSRATIYKTIERHKSEEPN